MIWVFVTLFVLTLVVGIFLLTYELSRQRQPTVIAIAAVVVAVGSLGAALSTAAAMRSGWMDGMMMGGGMMGSGSTGRSGEEPVAGAKTIEVSGGEFWFSPPTITIEAGDTANIEFRNDGEMFHTFTVPRLHLDLRANAGDSITGSLTAEEAGTYEFICSVPGHAAAGMRGTFKVQP